MKIYVGHSSGFDFKRELYEPLGELAGDYEFVFPHKRDIIDKSYEIIRTCDLFLAEVSFPSTGMGIEIGWADGCNLPIVCIYKSGFKPSSALDCMTDNFIEYENIEDLKFKLVEFLNKM